MPFSHLLFFGPHCLIYSIPHASFFFCCVPAVFISLIFSQKKKYKQTNEELTWTKSGTQRSSVVFFKVKFWSSAFRLKHMEQTHSTQNKNKRFVCTLLCVKHIFYGTRHEQATLCFWFDDVKVWWFAFDQKSSHTIFYSTSFSTQIFTSRSHTHVYVLTMIYIHINCPFVHTAQRFEPCFVKTK